MEDINYYVFAIFAVVVLLELIRSTRTARVYNVVTTESVPKIEIFMRDNKNLVAS